MSLQRTLALGTLAFGLGGDGDMTQKKGAPTEADATVAAVTAQAQEAATVDGNGSLKTVDEASGVDAAAESPTDFDGVVAHIRAQSTDVITAENEAVLAVFKDLMSPTELLELFFAMGAIGLLAMGLFISRLKNPNTAPDPVADAWMKVKIAPFMPELQAASAEMHELAQMPNPPEDRMQLAFARLSAVATGVFAVMIPNTAAATGIWEGIKSTGKGINEGVGGILDTVGKFAEALGNMSYALDIVAVLAIILGGMVSSDHIGRVFKSIGNNGIRRKMAVNRLTGPEGIARNLESRVGPMPGDVAARNAGATLRTTMMTRLAGETAALKGRIRSGEFAVGPFSELSKQLVEEGEWLLRTLHDATTNPAAVFPEAEFNARVARFNQNSAGLRNSLEAIPRTERVRWSTVGGLSLYAVALVMSLSWLNVRHIRDNSASGTQPAVTAPATPTVDPGSTLPPVAPTVPGTPPATPPAIPPTTPPATPPAIPPTTPPATPPAIPPVAQPAAQPVNPPIITYEINSQ